MMSNFIDNFYIAFFISLEILGASMLALVLFRFPYTKLVKELLFIAISTGVLMLFIYTVLPFHFVVNELLSIALLTYLFKTTMNFSWKQSWLIAALTYIPQATLTILFLFTANFFQLFNVADMLVALPIEYNYIQALNFFLLFGISIFLYRKGYGFSYDDNYKGQNKKLRKVNGFVLAMIPLDFLLLYFSFLLIVINHPYAWSIHLSVLIPLKVLLILLYRTSTISNELDFNNLKRCFIYAQNEKEKTP